MRIRCGTDVIEIKRIRESIEDKKLGETFLKKVYTSKEIEYCESRKNQKYQHYAARFAAKEATFKAISDQLNNKSDISWKQIEIRNNQQGRPEVHLIGIHLKDTEDMDLSISHCKEYAVANVTLLRK